MAQVNVIITLVCALTFTVGSNAQYSKFRIQGGRDPELNEVKYVVAVKSQHSICGGGIIDDKYIVTAAHCFKANMTSKTLMRPFEIVANTNSTYGYRKNVAIHVDVARAFIPSVRLVYPNLGDIAVLELKQSLNLKNHPDILEKMELPEPSRTNPLTYPTFSNLTVKAAGYGATSTSMNPDKTGKPVFKALYAGTLHVAEAKVIDNKLCKSTSWSSLNDAQVCVSVTEDPQKKKVQGLCNGDSGSPVVYNNYGRKIVVGVVSLNKSCNNNRTPTVLTRISSHISFIRKVMSGNITNDIIVFN